MTVPGRGRASAAGGFTLIELMVVAAIIIALLVVTLPTIKTLMSANQQSQSENTLRSSLMLVRGYALRNNVIAGIRFQEDGRAVPVCASNMSQTFSVDSFRAVPQYRMIAIPGESPLQFAGEWRVMAFEYCQNELPRATPHWWGGQQWYRCCVTLFSPRGRVMQAACVFPGSGQSDQWYPTMSGSFNTLTYSGGGSDPVFDYQGNYGIGYDSGGHISGMTVPTGPSVTTQFRLYNSSLTRGLMQNATVSATSQDGYTVYNPNNNVTQAMGAGHWNSQGAINATALDFVVDVNSGMLIRLGADSSTGQ